jgi:hypothetical protein
MDTDKEEDMMTRQSIDRKYSAARSLCAHRRQIETRGSVNDRILIAGNTLKIIDCSRTHNWKGILACKTRANHGL